MKVAPVRRYAEPDYPTNEVLKEHPELLARIPARWRANPVVLAALTSVLALAMGVRAKAAPTRVAPVFQHGVGRGAFGCVAVAAPVFLSEEEARQVVVEEGKRAGITFKTPGATVQTAVPLTEESGMYYRDEGPKADSGDREPKSWKLRNMALKLDGTDAKRKISFVYVSKGDFDAWERPGGEMMSTAIGFSLVDTAARVRDGLLQSKPGGTFGVFYDPAAMAPWGPMDDDRASYKSQSDARDAALQDLRKQVKDFIGWLKAQGVI